MKDLYHLRIENGYTQEQVAERLKIHRDTLRAIEKGESSLKVEHLTILSAMYGVSIEELLQIYIRGGESE